MLNHIMRRRGDNLVHYLKFYDPANSTIASYMGIGEVVEVHISGLAS